MARRNGVIAVGVALLVGGLACRHLADDRFVCSYKPADAATIYGGNEAIIRWLRSTHARASGRIVVAIGDPVDGALVELFPAKREYCRGRFDRAGEPEFADSDQRTAATWATSSGEFCLPEVPSGCYEIRASYSVAMDVTHVYLRLDPKSGNRERVEVQIEPGT